MALLDRFKKKNKTRQGEEIKKIEKKIEKKSPGLAWNILVAPHVTEKATYLAEQNKYIFKVNKNANKEEIKKAIRDVYGVDVKDVKIINIHPKKRRVGKRGEGWREAYKKAIVGIKKGQKIEILSR